MIWVSRHPCPAGDGRETPATAPIAGARAAAAPRAGTPDALREGMSNRPAVAYPTELAQEHRHFASGTNAPGEVRGLALSARHVGITFGEIRDGLLDELALFAGGLQELFVDSGAFSEVAWDAAAGRLVVVRPITHAGWLERFELYAWAAETYGRRARVVAPDCVGDQDETLRRLSRYASNVAAVAARGAQVIVPVQKGALPMSAMYARACAILSLAVLPIAGVPMKKDATSLADLAELVDSLPWYGARIHLLGLGPESKRFAAALRCIKSRRPNAEVTSDSVTIRRLVGRTNGRGGGPRAITRYQDEARAAGLRAARDVKAYAVAKQGEDEYQAELDRAHAAGWFDTELYDSLEEALAHRAAGYPEEPAENTATEVAA